MIINEPFIETRGEQTFLISKILDELNNVEKEIYFSVPNEYGNFLCDEVADAFVVAMLLPALVSGQDITVKSLISEDLYYQLENSLLYALSIIFNKKTIKIITKGTVKITFNPTSTATGFSGGIDSLVTFLKHSNNSLKSLELTELTLFNVGSYGDTISAQLSFDEDIIRAKEFAKAVKLPLVTLSSNISEHQQYDLIRPFANRFAINIISAVLALQKKFKTYLFSSGHPIEYIKVNSKFKDQANYDICLAYFLSNNNTKIIVTEVNKNRVDKTRLIKENELAKKFLYVCAADIYNDKHNTNYKKIRARIALNAINVREL